MKYKFPLVLALLLALTLCACTPSTPTEIDTTTKFTSEGFTLSIPNEYADLLLVDTTVSDAKDGTFFSVHEKASVEASKALWPDDETMRGGFLFSIGRVDEATFHEMMMWGMTGADVFARDEEGNYYIYYHPTDVQLVRVEYTDADWEQWGNLCKWADIEPTFLEENPRLIPYERTYQDIDCVLHYVAYGDGSALLTKKNGDEIYAPELSDSMPYLEQLLDDVMFYPLQNDPDFDLEGDYITLTAPEMYAHASFDFFVDEGQQQYIRMYMGLEPSYFVASRNGEEFPAGQVVSDWLSSLEPLPLTGLEAALYRLAYLQPGKYELAQIRSGAAVERLTPTRNLSLPYLKQLLNGTLSGGTVIEEIPDCDHICLSLLDGNLRFSFFPADSEHGTYVLREQHGAFPDLFLLSYDDGTIAGQIVQNWYNAAKTEQ